MAAGACASGACRPRSATSTRPCGPCWATRRRHGWCGARRPRSSSSTRCCPAAPSASRGRGHLGLTMLPQVVDEIASSGTTLVFTNTRSQAEIWYQAHPGSAAGLGRPDRAAPRLARPRGARVGRAGAEERRAACGGVHLAASTWASTFCRWSACCRSARPRAWRGCCSAPAASGHAPGRASRITAGAHARIEMVEGAAARARHRGRPHRGARVARTSRSTCWCSTSVTVALGGGFVPDALHAEVRVHGGLCAIWRASRGDWCLDFVRRRRPLARRPTPTTTASVPDDDGVGACPMRGWRAATA